MARDGEQHDGLRNRLAERRDEEEAAELARLQGRHPREAEIYAELRQELIAAAGSDRILTTDELAAYALSQQAMEGASIGLFGDANASGMHMQVAIQSGRSWFGFGDYNNHEQAQFGRIEARLVIDDVRGALSGAGVRIQTDTNTLAVRFGEILDARDRAQANTVRR